MDDAGRGSARVALIDAAERLIAEQGPAVSLRQVVTAAGQRNSAAIRYHFGSREDLIAAVVEARQNVFEPKRLELLAALEAEGDAGPRGLLEALLTPVFEHQHTSRPSYHARFMEKIRDYPGVDLVGRQDWTATTLIVARLTRAATPAPNVRAVRVRGLMTVVFALLADLERTPYTCADERAAAEEATVDMVLGVVTAPDSAVSQSRA